MEVGWKFAGLVLVLLGVAAAVQAQPAGRIAGTVVAARGGSGVAGVNVVVPGTLFAAVTDTEGRYAIEPVPPGVYDVQVNALGFRPERRQVEVAAGTTATADFRLRLPRPELDAREPALRPTLLPLATVEGRRMREIPSETPTDLLRLLPGAGAGRQGGLLFAPRVRGLGPEQIGVFADGVPLVGGGVVGLMPGLDRFDPLGLDRLTVVRGPYALTLGPGALAAVVAETNSEPPAGRPRGLVEAGYATNLGAFGVAAHGAASQGPLAVEAAATYQTTKDYGDGRGRPVPAQATAATGRGRLAYRLGPAARLTLRGGLARQPELAAPGLRIDDAEARAADASAHFQTAWSAGPVRALDVAASWTRTEEEFGGNDPRIVTLDTAIRTRQERLGARLALRLMPAGGWRLEAGAEAFTLAAEAPWVRPQSAEDWLTEVRRTGAGLFAAGTRAFGPVETTASLRLDLSNDDVAADVHLSAAAGLAVPLTPAVRLSAALGSTARTPTLVERYGRHVPYGRGHQVGPVDGTPALDPERATQADLGLAADFAKLDLSAAVFARRIEGYITPVPTFDGGEGGAAARFVNSGATFAGGEAQAEYALAGEYVTLNGLVSYVWGYSEALDGPALGTTPVMAMLGARLQAPARLFFIEPLVHVAAPHRRVARPLGEPETDGYATADLRFGASAGRLGLLLAVENLFGATYAYPLNAVQPVAGGRLAEPGRVFVLRLRLAV